MTAGTRQRAIPAGWWLPALPHRRAVLLRTILHAFVIVDVTLTTRWVGAHRWAPSDLYEPLALARALHLPAVTGVGVTLLGVAVVVAAMVGSVGWRPAWSGAAVFVLYLLWMLGAMSYGKVDHDRFAFLVALAVLPSIGRAWSGPGGLSERAGWALRMIQVAAVATYFLAAVAKFRYGGMAWLDSATLQRAVTRRGTVLGDAAAAVPGLLHVSQYLVVAFELLSPLMLARGMVRRLALGGAVILHVVTAATIGITFLPHVLCLLAFSPLERWEDLLRRRARPGRARARRASSPGSPLPSR